MIVRSLSAIGLAALLLAVPLLSRAEVNGEELLEMMQSDAGRQTAQLYIDDVWHKLNESLFCLPDGDPQKLSFEAVEAYLEANPSQLFRSRRYLIVQALRGAFPCEQG